MWNYRDKFLQNSYYHITNKSLNSIDIFKEKEDYEKFIDYIAKNLIEYPTIGLSAYSILPNHFHFVIKNNRNWLQISEFMRKIQVSYAMYFKKKYANYFSMKWLPVFQWRFKSKLIKDEEELRQIESYVNFDAINHKLAYSISDRPYTSLHQFIDTGFIENIKNIKIIWWSNIIMDHMWIKIDWLEI